MIELQRKILTYSIINSGGTTCKGMALQNFENFENIYNYFNVFKIQSIKIRIGPPKYLIQFNGALRKNN